MTMGRLGTHNAALVWRAVNNGSGPMSETEIREATDMGPATVNRMTKLLVQHGFMTSAPRIIEHGRQIAEYTAIGTLDAVRAKLGRGQSIEAMEAAARPMVFYGQGICRVSSIFQLGQA